jgi:hypothetical protein
MYTVNELALESLRKSYKYIRTRPHDILARDTLSLTRLSFALEENKKLCSNIEAQF